MHLVLHIGPHKTGSTAIQQAIWQSREALAGAGVFTWFADRMPEKALALAFAGAGLLDQPDTRRHFPTAEAARAWSRARWEEFEAAAAASDCRVAVLSSEHFASPRLPGPVFERLARRFAHVTVVAYARAPEGLFLSMLAQSLRAGRHRIGDLPVPGAYRYPYRRLLAGWAAAAGEANLVVRSFARENLAGSDVVTDFFGVLRRLAPVPEPRPVRANESLPAAALAWLAFSNQVIDPRHPPEARREAIRRLVASPAVAALPRLRLDDPLLAAALARQTAGECRWVNRRFLDGQVPLPEGEPAAAAPAGGDADEGAAMRRLLVAALTPQALDVIAAALAGPAPAPSALRRSRTAAGRAERRRAAREAGDGAAGPSAAADA